MYQNLIFYYFGFLNFVHLEFLFIDFYLYFWYLIVRERPFLAYISIEKQIM